MRIRQSLAVGRLSADFQALGRNAPGSLAMLSHRLGGGAAQGEYGHCSEDQATPKGASGWGCLLARSSGREGQAVQLCGRHSWCCGFLRVSRTLWSKSGWCFSFLKAGSVQLCSLGCGLPSPLAVASSACGVCGAYALRNKSLSGRLVGVLGRE